MNLPIIDLHEDLSYYFSSGSGLGFNLRRFDEDYPDRHGDIPKYERANVRLVFTSIFAMQQTINPIIRRDFEELYGYSIRAFAPTGLQSAIIDHVKIYYRLVKMFPEKFKIVRSSEDVLAAFRNKSKVNLLIAVEGCDALQEVDELDLLYNLGVRSIQLTWNFDNKFAASCNSKKDYGLTGEGERLIERANELGIILDLAHSSKKSFKEAIEVSKLPVIVSHSGIRAIHNSPRNLDDEEIEMLRNSGGVFGIIFSRVLIGGDDLRDLVKHLIYVRDEFGSEVLAIGSDYFGLIDDFPVRGLENIGLIQNLFEALRAQGFSEAELRGIAYENALRVMKENAREWKVIV